MSCETSRGKATVTQLCEALGVSRQAYYQARRQPKEGAKSKTRPERRGDWATRAELEDGVRKTVKEHKGWGTRKVWAYLRREGVRASQKRVWAVMHELGLVLPGPERSSDEAPHGKVAVPCSNRRWATDCTTVWTDQDGWVTVVPVVDCGDRTALACDVTKSQQAPPVLWPVARALRNEFGSPEAVPGDMELRSDHGPQYTGSDCERLCAEWNVLHTFAPVRRPTGNAIAERFIKTLKVELVWTRDWTSLEELQREIAKWIEIYNHSRPHQALNWETPAERRRANLQGCEARVAA